MSRIHQLDPVVINKIAAGEVIERPASVVKELLENSVDAMATRIEVDIAEGGTELIRVADDGNGIHPDDLLLSVTSHATSKIQDDADLFRVHTMGFRGEALASIASVSHFTVRSRREDVAAGVELVVEGGHPGTPTECGCPTGTIVECRRLFYNTPVRRRFLKTRQTEFGHISEQFVRVALANPRLHMVLRHNGKLVYDQPASSSLSERLRLFYGDELADKLIQVESETGEGKQRVRLWGYVAHPAYNKSTRRSQYLFLNGRWIQDRSLQHALGEAYRGLLMTGRFPVCYLFLEMPAEQVDVNVHPTKMEVRFRDSQVAYRQLLTTLRKQFLSMNLESELSLGAKTAAPATGLRLDAPTGAATPAAFRETRLPEPVAIPPTMPVTSLAPPIGSDRPAPALDPGADHTHRHVDQFEAASRDEPATSSPSEAVRGRPLPTATDPARAFQIYDCYLVVATDEGLTVIDQHALHERILYEELRSRMLAGKLERQRLLMPEAVELGPREATLLQEHQELLGELGFEIGDFGRSTVLVSSYPALLKSRNVVRIVRDIAEHLDRQDGKPTRRDLLEALLQMMACKAAIKSGHRLSAEEITSLLEQRHLVDDAHHCPHGRPTWLTLSRGTLDKQFGRLG